MHVKLKKKSRAYNVSYTQNPISPPLSEPSDEGFRSVGV